MCFVVGIIDTKMENYRLTVVEPARKRARGGANRDRVAGGGPLWSLSRRLNKRDASFVEYLACVLIAVQIEQTATEMT